MKCMNLCDLNRKSDGSEDDEIQCFRSGHVKMLPKC